MQEASKIRLGLRINQAWGLATQHSPVTSTGVWWTKHFPEMLPGKEFKRPLGREGWEHRQSSWETVQYGKGNSVFWEELRLYRGSPQQLTKMYNFIICIYTSLLTPCLGQTSPSLGLNIPFFLATFVTYFIFRQPPLIFSLPHKRSLRSNNLNNENKILPYSYYPFHLLHFTSNISEIHDHACSLHLLIQRAAPTAETDSTHGRRDWLPTPVVTSQFSIVCSLCTITDFPLLETLCSTVYIMPLCSSFLTTYHSFMTAVWFFFF